ncbi:unnamed protein product [Candidula unifasciata]|uniref:Polysaccharide pyruvyl transferase domain-containing protein n=1 Tax=Candidula unifasciata TaxID=100452 RepID=A0A8S3YMD0_9EUPU|nr:unnamed protein product [Candidula unifasciata]
MLTQVRKSWKPALTVALVFIAWTVSTFICHKSGKLFLLLSEEILQVQEGDHHFYSPLIRRFCLAFILTAVQVSSAKVIDLLNVLSTFKQQTNETRCLWLQAASTLAIKLTEPVTMAIGHHLVTRTGMPLQTAISIPIIISGAVVFTDITVQHNFNNITGALLAFASNVILTVRNLALKHIQNASNEHAPMTIKPGSHIKLVVLAEVGLVGLVAYLQTIQVVTRNVWTLLALCLTSGVFHVVYSYISTNVVLKVMNVVSHSIANIFKRFLVVLLLYMGGNRQITAMNFFGLCMSLAGERVKGQSGKTKTYLAIGLLALISMLVIGSTIRPELLTLSHSATESVASSTFRESYGWGENHIFSADFSHILKEETDPDMRKFLTRRLVEIPEDTDRRAKMLTSNKQVIEEEQRILVNLLQDLLGKAKYAMLIDIPDYDNKGDSAVSFGEILLLRKVEYHSREINKKYVKEELVVFLQGGGNLVGYNYFDTVREQYISMFPDRRVILFSQSIWLRGGNLHELKYPLVYTPIEQISKGVQLILAPDMAFCIGIVPRQLPPIYDIVWLKRSDDESTKYVVPSFPPNISVDVNDWVDWKSNFGKTAIENVFLRTYEAFQFLQRGRVVVTDRLHGHILSTLMNIPHVLIDNPPYLKLSSFDKSWTASLRNTRLVSNGSQALSAAMELLRTYHNSLPPVGFRDVSAESHTGVTK